MQREKLKDCQAKKTPARTLPGMAGVLDSNVRRHLIEDLT